MPLSIYLRPVYLVRCIQLQVHSQNIVFQKQWKKLVTSDTFCNQLYSFDPNHDIPNAGNLFFIIFVLILDINQPECLKISIATIIG